MIERLLTQVLADADSAHRQHLISESYSEHVALFEFYASARDKVDGFVESAIGLDLPLPEAPETPTLEMLETAYVDLVERRDETCQGSTVLQNLYDELLHVYTNTIYTLKRLK